jgi:hypothetical protein
MYSTALLFFLRPANEIIVTVHRVWYEIVLFLVVGDFFSKQSIFTDTMHVIKSFSSMFAAGSNTF